MNTIFRCACLLLMAIGSVGWADEQAQLFQPTAFLQTHCIRCHGKDRQKADRRFDNLPGQIANLDAVERYQEIVDQLNLASMPPEDELQPSAEQRGRMITHLTRTIAEAQDVLSDAGGHAVLRRLNSWEYRQSIGDLLGLNVDVRDPGEACAQHSSGTASAACRGQSIPADVGRE